MTKTSNANCLKFTALEYSKMFIEASFAEINLSYSYDKRVWSRIKFNKKTSICGYSIWWENDIIDIDKGKTLYLKGDNSFDIAHSIRFFMDGLIAAGGSIAAITNTPYCRGMFKDCEALVTAPRLPFTKLVENCYMDMFFNCWRLKAAPKLPAMKLAKYCYDGMLYNCHKLKVASELPAMWLKVGCYAYMFWGCDSLRKAPKLPAMKLAKNCYRAMFRGDKNLVIPPKLPATVLEKGCYSQMFWDCDKLLTTPLSPTVKLIMDYYTKDMLY